MKFSPERRTLSKRPRNSTAITVLGFTIRIDRAISMISSMIATGIPAIHHTAIDTAGIKIKSQGTIYASIIIYFSNKIYKYITKIFLISKFL